MKPVKQLLTELTKPYKDRLEKAREAAERMTKTQEAARQAAASQEKKTETPSRQS